MPIEVLETIANINYNTPRPRPIDPAAFFDLVKIRRLVDEATNLAVRAASDVASPTLTSLHGTLAQHSNPGYSLDGGGYHGYGGYGGHGGGGGGGHGGLGGHKLSKERKHRMRVEAAAKLARAYRLDEIATSVATMQGASPIDEIGALVLTRNAADRDAQYVHFFHEKIPSRQLARSTSLRPLDEIVMSRPHGADGVAEALRTRATVRNFKEDYDGAVADLTAALASFRFGHGHGATAPVPDGMELVEIPTGRRRTQDIILDTASQPSSLEPQLLFHRAVAHLALACTHVSRALPDAASNSTSTPTMDQQPPQPSASGGGDDDDDDAPPPSPPPLTQDQTDGRKAVKTYAKRALRDIMLYLSHFEYSPDLPVRVTRDFTQRVNLAAHGNRNTRVSDPPSTPPPPHTVYTLNTLFAAVPPAGLPEINLKYALDPTLPQPESDTFEAATFHPLLTDALHCLLLCHCLAQTSTTELTRHAYMVARLARLADGYPIFQASRSPARSDWMEILRKTHLGASMSASWEKLCAPAPLPASVYEPFDSSPPIDYPAVSAAAMKMLGLPAPQSPSQKTKPKPKAIKAPPSASSSDLSADSQDSPNAVTTSLNALQISNLNPPSTLTTATVPMPLLPPAQSLANKRWSIDDGREYPILTERAGLVSRWVRDVPLFTVAGGAKKKRRSGVAARRTATATTSLSSVRSGSGDALRSPTNPDSPSMMGGASGALLAGGGERDLGDDCYAS